MRDVLRSDLSDLESKLIAVWIGTVAFGLVIFGLLLALHFLPRSAQQRVVSASTRWNKALFGLLDRAAYPWAVLMVVTIGLMLIGAVAMLFVPR